MSQLIQPIPQFARKLSKDSSLKFAPIIIAGPCSVESREQILSTAESLSKIEGVDVLRAGIWKPRTHPGSFEGIGEKGLSWLREAGDLSGLPIATEVATEAHVKEALEAGVDMLWIGARTSVNPFAVQEIANTIAALSPDTPVLVKNPVNPDLELWIGAIQRLLQAGVTRVGAIHRGFSAYNSAPFRNLPMWQLPMELHRRMSDLPIIHDPSHTGGSRELLATLSQQALDLGFNGLMIETHPSPDNALSDGGQQITPDELNNLLREIVVKTAGRGEAGSELEIFRKGIDECDGRLLELLSERMKLSEEIGEYKAEHNMKVLQPQRYERLLSALVEKGEALGLDSKFIERLLKLIHEESVRLQLEISKLRKDL